MKLPTLEKAKNLKGKRVLIRVDLNVPMKEGAVADDFRMRKILPTIKFLKKEGAKVIIMSHIGRKPEDTLLPVSTHLAASLKHVFVPDYVSEEGKAALAGMKNGDVALLENLRKWEGEKAGDKKFTASLAALGDIYVNEAFAVSHRKDASVYALPKLLPSYFGPLFASEIEGLSLAFKKYKGFLFILGGAKFETKMPLIKKYLGVADSVYVGGALANNFFKTKGYEVGASLVDAETPPLASLLKNKKLLLATDVLTEGPAGKGVKKPDAVLPDEKILDCGPDTIKTLEEKIKAAKFVLWNGPLGYYEGGYDASTLAVARALGKAEALAVVGGGDTVAAIEKLGLKKKNIFVSTAGGAMLEYLAKGSLPGADAILLKKPAKKKK